MVIFVMERILTLNLDVCHVALLVTHQHIKCTQLHVHLQVNDVTI